MVVLVKVVVMLVVVVEVLVVVKEVVVVVLLVVVKEVVALLASVVADAGNMHGAIADLTPQVGTFVEFRQQLSTPAGPCCQQFLEPQ